MQLNESLGLAQLMDMYRSRYCFPLSHEGDVNIPKSNDFSDLAEYFVQKSLISAIAASRDKNGQTPSEVKRFLIDVLKWNDNEGNSVNYPFFPLVMFSILDLFLFFFLPFILSRTNNSTDTENYITHFQNLYSL